MKNIFLLFAIVLLIFSGCKKDKTKDVMVFIDPAAIHIYTAVDKIISFGIKAESEFPLVNFKIHYKEPGASQVFLKDTLISPAVKKFNYTFEFKIPESWAGKSIILIFNAYDQEGNVGTSARTVIVDPIENTPILLTETAGHYFYSTHSGELDAFDIETGTPQLILTAIPGLRDIQDFDTIPTDSILARSWNSGSSTQFVRFNGFDYANATNISTVDAFNSGTKLQIVNNIQLNDIIIAKTSSGNYGVIKITNIFDLPGVANDRYEFNMKKNTQ
ncbi:MAG: hypothetical protein HND27_04265 [Bacteroidetes bacterium]|nr:hypothetical protein [Bacteroidota bacterium]MBV6460297.1 hypothetical protein [Flavobacteriales bacterium]WKZ74665.1 MAG: hypothetical protein QY303_11000 [Vicingaceae bacterium]MCL4815837.1 hypothetical protein [Flavobacteriales bacterium]NOG94972.1 hypothetical protein [Bacteroidota bacterium]